MKIIGCSFQQVLQKNLVGFCLTIGKCFFLEVSFHSQQKERRFFKNAVLRILKIALLLRGWHVFMWKSVEILNIFNTLKQIFCKTKIFLQKNLSTIFQRKVPRLKTINSIQNCHVKSQCKGKYSNEYKMDLWQRSEFWQ